MCTKTYPPTTCHMRRHRPGFIINYTLLWRTQTTKVFIHPGCRIGFTLLSKERSTFIYWNCSAMWKIFREGINFLWCYLRLARWLVRTTRPCPHVISVAQSRSHYLKGHIWSYGQVNGFIWIHELQIKSQKPELSNGLTTSFIFRCPSSHVAQRGPNQESSFKLMPHNLPVQSPGNPFKSHK